jgi:hypothetical protein
MPTAPSPLRRFAALPGPDRALLARAAAWVVLARLALWALPYRRTRELADRYARVTPRGRRRAAPERTAWAVEATARRIPRATCLTQALAAEVMLRRAGHLPQVHIGVAKDRAAIEAHAWLELDGRVLVGDHDLGRYTRLQPPPA